MVIRARKDLPSSHCGKANWIGCTVTLRPLADKNWGGMAEERELRELEGRQSRQSYPPSAASGGGRCQLPGETLLCQDDGNNQLL